MPTKSARSYSIALIITDFLILVLAFSLAYTIRTQFDDRPLVADVSAIDFLFSALLLAPLWQVVFWFLGLYSSSIYSKRLAEVGRLFVGAFIGILLVLGYAFVIDQPVLPARLVAVYAFLGAFLLLVFGREFMRQFRTALFRAGVGINRVMIFGDSEAITDIAENLDDTRHSGFQVVALVCPKKLLPNAFSGEHFVAAEQALKAIKSARVDTIIQTDLYDSAERNQKILGVAQNNHINYSFIPGEPEFYSGKNTVDVFLGYPIINVHQTPLAGWGEVGKRIFDLIVTSIILIILSPVLVVIIILQKTFNHGPIFYISKRLTRYSKPIGVYKFRSMDARYGKRDAAVEFREMGREDLAMEYGKYRKVENDPRITRFGQFLRVTSVDELPQLFNVMKGDLSLVGPRPILPQELPLYRGRGALLHSVKSGVTGLWQVSGRSSLSFDKRVELELYYAQNWSFWLDIKILFKTFGALFKKGDAK